MSSGADQSSNFHVRPTHAGDGCRAARIGSQPIPTQSQSLFLLDPKFNGLLD
jgi:hypothetical protein